MKQTKHYLFFLSSVISLDAGIAEVAGFFSNSLTYYDAGDNATALDFSPESFSINTASSNQLTLSVTFQDDIKAQMNSDDGLSLKFRVIFWKDGTSDSDSIGGYNINSSINFYYEDVLVETGTADTWQRTDGKKLSLYGGITPDTPFAFNQIEFSVTTNPLVTGELSNYIATDTSLIGWDYRGLDRTTLELVAIPEHSYLALLASTVAGVFVFRRRR